MTAEAWVLVLFMYFPFPDPDQVVHVPMVSKAACEDSKRYYNEQARHHLKIDGHALCFAKKDYKPKKDPNAPKVYTR